jgi:polyhydroxyalkanoate synthesis regulator phasin
MSPPPQGNGYTSFASLGSGDVSTQRLPPDTPAGESSYSYSLEDHIYQKEVDAARKHPSSRKRKPLKRDDNAPYRRGDDDYSEDSDDNPDPTVGVAARGGLRQRRSMSAADLQDAQPLRPRIAKGRDRAMSDVDEGIEHEAVEHADDLADEDEYVNEHTSPARSPVHFQVLEPSTTLPRAYRQPNQLEHLLHDAKLRSRSWLAWLRKNPLALVGAVAMIWLAFLLSRSSGAAPTSPYVPRPLPDNFDELASRLGGLESSHAKDTVHWSRLDQRIARLEAEQTVLYEVKQQQAAVLADNRRTKDQMGATIGRVDKLERRVDTLEGLVANALNDGSLRDAVSKILPAVMPVRRAKNGGWDIDDSFFAVFMKRLLYGTGSLEQEIRHLVNQGVETEAKRWSEDWKGDGKRLTERVEQMLSSHTAEILISREDFVHLLEEKTQELWREIKAVQENTHSSPTAIKLKTSKGEDVTAMLQGIVDASLLRYSNDKLGMVDYALYSAGARVIEGTTSRTLQLTDEPSFLGRLWGKKAVHARPPHIALHPDTTVGQCWAFEGPAGDLGVLLSQPNVIVSSITIDHVDKSLASDISSAPKDIEVVSSDRRSAWMAY